MTCHKHPNPSNNVHTVPVCAVYSCLYARTGGISKTEISTVHLGMCVVASGGSTGVYELGFIIAGGKSTTESKLR
jgi:hypothetical protein